MNKKLKVFYIVITAMLLTPLLSYSQNSQKTKSQWTFGLNYISGFSDLIDCYEEIGYTFSYEMPVGMNIAFSQEYSSGLGWELNLGPMILVFGDTDGAIIPIDLTAKYYFNTTFNTSPYIQAGGSYSFVSGNELENGSVGFKGAVGIVFNRLKNTQYGFQVAYNSTSVEFLQYKEIKPYEFTISLFVSF